jgi:hypothetical protein
MIRPPNLSLRTSPETQVISRGGTWQRHWTAVTAVACRSWNAHALMDSEKWRGVASSTRVRTASLYTALWKKLLHSSGSR